MGKRDEPDNDSSTSEEDVFTIAEDDENQQQPVVDDDEEDKVPPIPDGGWGWVVVTSSFVIFVITNGTQLSYFLLYNEVLDEFKVNSFLFKQLKHLFTIVPLFTGPIMSSLVNRYGCRSMTILGGIITFLGFVLASISTSIEMMTVSVGVISGLGVGVVHMTAIVSIVHWFKKKRSLAIGLGICGLGIGNFVYALLTQYSNIVYGWRGSILLIAGTTLNLCVCGCVMRDPEWITFEQNEKNNKCGEKINREGDKLMAVDEKTEPSERSSMPGQAVYNEITQSRETIEENKHSITPKKNKEVRHRNCFMVNMFLFKKITFILFYLSILIFYLTYIEIFFNLQIHYLGYDKEGSSVFVGVLVLGVSNYVGKIVLGWVGDRYQGSIGNLYATFLVVCGMALLLAPTVTIYSYLVILSAAYNMLVIASFIFTPTLLVKLVSLDNFTSAYGLVLFARGIGKLFGPTLSDLLHINFYFSTGFKTQFYMAGGLIMAAGILIYLIRPLGTCQKRRQHEEEQP